MHGRRSQKPFPCPFIRSSLAVVAALAVMGGWLAADAFGQLSLDNDDHFDRALPPGQLPDDSRLGELRDLNGYFPFSPPLVVQEWEARREQLRYRVQFSLGLWPMPTRTPLNPVCHGYRDLGDYTVEKVYFESFPGFFVTGNLYRPKGLPGPLPAVLCPHGHYDHGRFHDAGDDAIQAQIENGAEACAPNARSPLQARCVHLARMGAVVFHYDMIGYADSQQISEQVAHRFSDPRPQMHSTERWGLYSPQAETHLQSVMGLQTWNSIRALDFLESLPDVDPTRIGVTGSSGGGTQTFILSAIDPRPAAAFPAVMVSTAMQGGCTCENCCNLRVTTGNVEIAALFAPKPLGLSAADDWTKEMEIKGFPQLKQLYSLLGKPDNVQLTSTLQYPHGYNRIARRAMYRWFDKHLRLNGKLDECPFAYLSAEQLSVWDNEHPQPQGGEEFERQLLQHWNSDRAGQLAWPKDPPSLDRFKYQIARSTEAALGASAERRDTVASRSAQLENAYVHAVANKYLPQGYVVPELWISPNTERQARFVIWLTDQGKSALLPGNQPNALVGQLLQQGICVAGIDLFGQGEFLADDAEPWGNRLVDNPRQAAAYTFGYNPTLFAWRADDLINVFSFPGRYTFWNGSAHVTLVALDSTASVAAVAAAALQDQRIDSLVLNTAGFRFARVDDFRNANFFPGGAVMGDVPAYLAAQAPRPLWLAGEEQSDDLAKIAAAYRAAGAEDKLHWISGQLDKTELAQRAVQWIIEQSKE